MYQNSHHGVTVIHVAPISTILTATGLVELAVAAGVMAIALAVVPDPDQRVPGIAHRGPTHTAWFALVTGMLTAITAVVLVLPGQWCRL